MRCILPLALVAVAALSGSASAAKISTAELGTVLTHASHVALGAWVDEDTATAGPTFQVERWLRGSASQPRIQVHGVPGTVRSWTDPRRRPLGLPKGTNVPQGDVLSERGVLCLEELDGRLYLTGMRRYGDQFGAHASVRAITRQGLVMSWEQVRNPGGPVPVLVPERTWAAFEPVFVQALEAWPYAPQGPARPPVALAHRASFFQALGPALDWYQGGPANALPGWDSGLNDPQGVRGRIARLQEWLASVPGPERLPGLEALLMLSSPRDVPAPDRAALLEVASEHVHQVPRDQVLAWLERETEHGRYGVDRTAVALLARRLGPDAYERVLGLLEAWVARTGVNEGTSAWHVLHALGEGARAEAAQASRGSR